MLTRKELCQCFLSIAQKKFSKPMTELDTYYAGAEVGIALAYLGMIKDPNTIGYIKNNPCTLFRHTNGRELTCIELLSLLPESDTKIEINETETNQQITSFGQLKEKLGERKYYRLLDAFEGLQSDEVNLIRSWLKITPSQDDTQSPAT